MNHWKNKSLENIIEHIKGVGIIYEEWRNIKGYEGLYQVSNFGRVKALEKVVNGREYKTKIMSLQELKKGGYIYIRLCKDSKYTFFYVHILVAMAFISNPNKSYYW